MRESGPGILAGVVFALFGGVPAAWTGTRLRQGRPVVDGVSPVASGAVASLAATVSLIIGYWCPSGIRGS